MAGPFADLPENLAEGIGDGAAKLVNGALGGAPGERGLDRLRNVAGINRLHARLAADQRHHRCDTRHRAETVEEIILGPEDQAWAQNHRLGESREHPLLALALGARINGSGEPAGADGRDMDQGAHPLRPCCLGNPLRRFGVDGAEALPPGLLQNANQIHSRVGAAQRFGHGPLVAHIRLDQRNLAHGAQRLQMQRQVWPPHRDLDPAPRPRQGLHHIAAEKPRAAEDCDNGRISQCDRHGGPVYLKHRRSIE